MNSIAPDGLAVVVVDAQAGLLCTEPAPFEAVEVITQINSVISKARSAGVPIIFIQHDGPADGDWLVPHTQGWQLPPQLQRDSGDLFIRKTTGDAFYGTSLEELFRSRGIRSLVLMGY